MKLYALIVSVCLVILSYSNYEHNKRLNEHKRIIIEQQKQINQLIRYERIKIYNK